MIANFSRRTEKSQIAALDSVFRQERSRVEWFVIAHRDPHLVNSLSSALAGRSATVLQVPQDKWDFACHEFIETVESALRQGKVRNLVLVGSSQGGCSVNEDILVPGIATAKAGSYEKLLEGTRRQHASGRQVQAAFARHVRQMSHIPVVHSRWREGALAVYGLFYRAECALFLHYDIATDTFQPLCS